MDNKLIFENWRRFLTEAELQYSKSAAQEIEDRVKKYLTSPAADKDEEADFWIEIPQKEIYYSNNPKIINGAVFYRLTRIYNDWDWDNPTDGQLDELQSLWDSSSKSFKPEFIERQLEYDLPMQVVINKKDSSSQGFSSAAVSSKTGRLFFYLAINPMNMSGNKISDMEENMKDTVRHELQHVTQRLNGLALNYGEQLDKANGDFSKIKVVKDADDIKKFGIGREKTGLRQAQGKEKQDLDRAERTKRYLGDDFEYETWMSDIISQFIRFSVKQGSVTPQDIEQAKLTDTLITMVKFHQDKMQSAKDDARRQNIRQSLLRTVKQWAEETGKSTKEVIAQAQGQGGKTFDQIATDLVRELIKGMDVSHPTFRDDEGNQMWRSSDVLKGFGRDTDSANVMAFLYLSNLRKKEFLGDFLANLTQRLKEQ